MKKINYIFIALIGLIIISTSAFFYFQNYLKAKNNVLPDEKTKLMEDIKRIFKMDLNPIPWPIKWNLEKGETYFDGSGYYYTDLLQSEKIKSIFKNLDDYFKQNGFNYDLYNQPVKTDKKESAAYKKGNIVCNSALIDNPNKTSSLIAGCSYADKTICDTVTGCGLECNSDSDCRAVIDGCNKKTVCKNSGLKYFDNCAVSYTGEDLNLDVQFCQCSNNKCVPKKLNENKK